SAAGGSQWGHTRSWTNAPGYAADTLNGQGVAVAERPRLLRDPTGQHYALISNGTTARFFDLDAGGTGKARFGAPATLDTAVPGEVSVTDGTGNVLTFFGFNVAPAGLRGQFKRLREPTGIVTEVVNATADGNSFRCDRVLRTIPNGTGTVLEAYEYAYVASGD